jgi:hypothetical protein
MKKPLWGFFCFAIAALSEGDCELVELMATVELEVLQ